MLRFVRFNNSLARLWVKHNGSQATQVSTAGFMNTSYFKKKLSLAYSTARLVPLGKTSTDGPIIPELYLNIQYGSLVAEVDITGISRLGGVQDAIKAKYGPAMADIGAPQLQLYTNTNRDQLINDLDDITPDKTPQYYQKLTQGGSCVVIGTSNQGNPDK
jgi:hypothetical protein